MFGQVVIGPPGSGKTTYCAGMEEFLRGIGRNVVVVNLDPANDTMAYEPTIDVGELVDLGTVMEEEGLGPNGGLIYCIEYLAANLDWLEAALGRAVEAGEGDSAYVLFDCPGQVELYTHHPAMRSILQTLTSGWNLRLAAVHLVDASYCTDPTKYLSVLLTSLSTMVQLELPHVNVLSKMDIVQAMDETALDFNLDYYLDVMDLSYLVDAIQDRDQYSGKYHALTKALAGLVSEFSLVAFAGLNIQDKDSVASVVEIVDKANGYVFGGFERPPSEMDAITALLNPGHDRASR